MEEIFHHHAVAIEGERAETVASIRDALEKAKIGSVGNPDVLFLDYETLGIDEVRELIVRAGERALLRGGKWFVVSFFAITREAQNALLKTIEEPGEATHFVFVTPDVSRILSTLRSRMRIVRRESAESSEEAEQFLANSLSARLAFITPIVKDKDRPQAVLFLRSLEGTARARDLARTHPSFVHDLIRLRNYLGDTGSSVKHILEFIAYAAPRR